MRIGIDVTFLSDVQRFRAGFDSYLFGLLNGLQAINPRPDVRLFACENPAEPLRLASMTAAIQSRNIDFPLSIYRRPSRRPFRLREAWEWRRSGLACLDVLQAIDCLDFPRRGRALRAFLIPDLSALRRPEDHLPRNIDHWRANCHQACHSGDLIVTFSEHTRREVVEEFRIPPERVVAIPLGIDEAYRPMPSAELESRLRPHDLVAGAYFLTVGTIEPRKNHIGLFRAYAELGHCDWPLIVVGGPGWKCDDILAEPKRLGIEDRVRFLGRQEDLVALYGGAGAFVYPSFYEGFGLPPLEAMACGAPVACSNATSLPEIVGDAAITFDPNDVAAIAAALRTLMTNESLRESLRDRGLERAKRFRWIDTARGYLTAYESALRRAG